ncbi:hypothetical protein MUK70_18320 [Dyadobacter chenwenxiniae]|uniref:Uncharacterized protein n=1 Tax=Dyadobacter chenwenxiniae TaxID=2906456 RepID=A0A9X1TKF0_9BACT|nr:hypothetical protein [Dyadobacter chenwenxiniae]MCF0061198.1 hypothetical protein [Dyadobacter chenwenxiniae]UON81022.1 hypothetical protein MUK70_18320 [Dyadobacter chenwenxiniae]
MHKIEKKNKPLSGKQHVTYATAKEAATAKNGELLEALKKSNIKDYFPNL